MDLSNLQVVVVHQLEDNTVLVDLPYLQVVVVHQLEDKTVLVDLPSSSSSGMDH